MSKLLEDLKLNSGRTIPRVGYGTGGTDIYNNPPTISELYEVFKQALDIGYRHFDSAIMYGNEKNLGEVFKKIFAEGKYKREDIFVTSKFLPQGNLTVEQQIKESLENLQFEYLDAYLIHFTFLAPNEKGEFTHKPLHKTWAELEDVQQKGLVKNIGISNCQIQIIVDLLSYAKIKPSILQIEFNLLNQQHDLLEFCQKFGIQVTAYSPLAQGAGINDPLVQQIAQKYGKKPAQVVLNFLAKSLGLVIIPKTHKVERLPQNIELNDFTLTEEEVQQLKGLNINKRTIDTKHYPAFGNIPFYA